MPPGFERIAEIQRCSLPFEGALFEELLASVRFEDVGKGRQGAVLVKVDADGDIPLVRTTTRYSAPAQPFQPVHERLARAIQDLASLPVAFNNALIEKYTNAYTTMGAHSDQALDLDPESHIAILSCYRHPDVARAPRKLLVEAKETGGEKDEIPLDNKSVIVFSVAENRRFRHRIVLGSSGPTPENEWIGVTFRASRTWVRFTSEGPCFQDGEPLSLADEGRRREFYRLRRRENEETTFAYPRITYTLSESDRMPPESPPTNLQAR